ncbi:MAG: hypothetical protein LC114_20740 [Bryobacterales bacterium]|nr:hypothetical protein [Bryobacterales bacterium]
MNSEVVFSPSEDAKRLYGELVSEIRRRELSGLENFDKAILAYSSGGLGLSIGFLKDFVSISEADISWALYCSWISFAFAVGITVTSFLVSGAALRHQELVGYQYYMEGKDEARAQKNGFNSCTRLMNYASGVLFLFGVAMTVLFTSMNLEKGTENMRKDRTIVFDGATIPTMQKVQVPTEKKGITVPSIQKVPASNPTPSPQQQPSGKQ